LARTGRKAVPRPAHSAALVTALQVASCTKQVRRRFRKEPMFTSLCPIHARSTAAYRLNGDEKARQAWSSERLAKSFSVPAENLYEAVEIKAVLKRREAKGGKLQRTTIYLQILANFRMLFS